MSENALGCMPPSASVSGSRPWATLRFVTSVTGSALLTFVAARLVPQRLSVVTDIVGYPIHSNYDCYVPFYRYYLAVLLFPACALALYHAIGKRWPRSRWPTGSAGLSAPAEPQPAGSVLAMIQTVRVLAVGATFGLGWTLWGARGTDRFWRDLAFASAAYAILPLGFGALLARRRASLHRLLEGSSRLNALLTPFAIVSLYAASAATQVRVTSNGSVHAYPWLPGWLAIGGATLLATVTLGRLLGARDLEAARRIETQGLLFVVGPIVLFLYTATLPAPVGGFDAFHAGEFLTGAWLVGQGAFPWRDIICIHGLLQDVLTSLAGFRLFGDTIWGGMTGFAFLATPLWWLTHYLLFVYLFRGRAPLLLAALAVPLLAAFPYVHWRFIPFPLILLALAGLLRRATWLRAIGLALLLVVANVLVPELAYAVPACGAVLLGFELSRYRRGGGLVANLPRCTRVAISGAAAAGLWFLFLVRHRAAGAFLHYYATFAPGHELTGAIPIPQPQMTNPTYLTCMLLPPALVLLAWWYVVAHIRARRVLDIRDWVAIAASLVTLVYYKKYLSRPDWHVAQALAPAVPLTYYAIDRLIAIVGKRSPVRWIVVGSGLTLATTLWLAGPGLLTALSRLPLAFSQTVAQPPITSSLGWSSLSLAGQATNWSSLQEFLDTYLEPGDRLFDFTNQPGLYHFLLRRLPATRYYHVSMTIRRETQLDLVEELERSRPKLVAFQSETGGLGDWDDVPTTVRHYEISRYLLQHYRPFARVTDQVFLARKDRWPEPRRVPPASTELLSGPAVYSGMRACDWGYAPNFMPDPPFRPGPRAEPGIALPARRLTVRGWAADSSAKRPAREVVATLADGQPIGRAIPGQYRPDVAGATGVASLGRSGFVLAAEWTASRARPRIYAVSTDGQARELETPWRISPAQHDEFEPASPLSPPPDGGKVVGKIEFARLEVQQVAAFQLPLDSVPAEGSGLEIDLDSSGDGMISVSDVPFAPSGSPAADIQPMSFRVPAGIHRTFRLMLDNCPQWQLLRTRDLYLRHSRTVRLRGLRILANGDGPPPG